MTCEVCDRSDQKDHPWVAILCSHVILDRLSILGAARDEPLDIEDTGWQFHCNVLNHDASSGGVICMKCLLELDGSLEALLTIGQIGEWFCRESSLAKWTKQ